MDSDSQHLPSGLFYQHPVTHQHITAGQYRAYIAQERATHPHGYRANLLLNQENIALSLSPFLLFCVLILVGYRHVTKSVASTPLPSEAAPPIFDDPVWAEIDSLIAGQNRK